MGAMPPVTVVLDADAQCRHCGYLLRELIETRCPECGGGFDPNDLATFRSKRGTRLRWRRRIAALIPTAVWTVICLAAAALWILLQVGRGEPYHARIFLAVTLVIATFTRSRVRRRLLKGKPDARKRSERLAAIAIYMFSAYYFVLGGGAIAWSCPHGTAAGFGLVGIAHSSNGGPCRNRFPQLRSWHVRGDVYVWIAWR